MPDVTQIIEDDHREVERLFVEYAAAVTAEEKDRLIDELRLELAPHAGAEEILVYPALRRAVSDGKDQADEAIDEHQAIKRLLSEVEKMSATDPDRDQRVRELQMAVEHHVAEEEGTLLPSLRASMDEQKLAKMGDLFEKMKPLLPTHPHPAVPGTATAQLLTGPLASVADRIRDFVGR
jgi:hemerythrin superfamily protein